TRSRSEQQSALHFASSELRGKRAAPGLIPGAAIHAPAHYGSAKPGAAPPSHGDNREHTHGAPRRGGNHAAPAPSPHPRAPSPRRATGRRYKPAETHSPARG